ncbi:MAG: hypothetical protein KJI69_03590 [Patescibacteria group bacterium]|nr:hypothetical protein [Patescibacteria group bacterium]
MSQQDERSESVKEVYGQTDCDCDVCKDPEFKAMRLCSNPKRSPQETLVSLAKIDSTIGHLSEAINVLRREVDLIRTRALNQRIVLADIAKREAEN